MISKHALHNFVHYESELHNLAYWENEFSSQELDIIQNNAKVASQTATLGAENRLDFNYRSTMVNWAHKDSNTEWLYNRISHVIASINAKYFSYDLTGLAEPFQLANYKSEDEGHYDWHRDSGGLLVRKLSLVLQLTDPSEFEGGNLELFNGLEYIKVRKQRGLIVVFPSSTFHRVTPVTSGHRQSLVAWINGPRFR